MAEVAVAAHHKAAAVRVAVARAAHLEVVEGKVTEAAGQAVRATLQAVAEATGLHPQVAAEASNCLAITCGYSVQLVRLADSLFCAAGLTPHSTGRLAAPVNSNVRIFFKERLWVFGHH